MTLREIRKEYDEPFTQVIRGYARLGYSERATAEAMEMNKQTLHRWLNRFDLHRYFDRRNYNESCIPRGKGWPKGLKGQNGMTREAWETRRAN